MSEKAVGTSYLQGTMWGRPSKEDHLSAAAQQKLSKRDTQVVSAYSAGIRAVLYQFTYMYMRNPAKMFRPARFDYMNAVRQLMHGELAKKPWKFQTHSGIAMLYNSIKKGGWRFVRERMLPPIIANSVVGVVLYSTYLTSLQHFSGRSEKNITDPHPFDTFRAGMLAGAVSSLVASPIDALYARASFAGLAKGGQESSMVQYAVQKLRQIGPFGIFAGFGLNCLKESLGFAAYFAIFEAIKNQGYHMTRDVSRWLSYWKARILRRDLAAAKLEHRKTERILQLSFILFAGATAATGLMAVQYPLNRLQSVHMGRLEALDLYNEVSQKTGRKWFRLYYHSYLQTMEIVESKWRASGLSFRNFIYKGFLRTTLTSIPATSTGLLVFEIGRRQLADQLLPEDLQEMQEQRALEAA